MMLDELNNPAFEQESIVVAGGAGEVGEGIVAALLAAGAVVVVPSRSRAKLDALASAMGATSKRLVPLEVDVSTEGGRSALRAALAATPPLRGVVLSLGGFWQGPPVLDVEVDAFRQTLEPRLFVPLALLQALRPHFRGNRTTVLQINALSATVALPGLSALHVSAAAELALTRCLIADATSADPNYVSLLIDAWVRTRSRRDLGWDALDVGVVGAEVARQIAHARGHSVQRLGLAEGRPTLTLLVGEDAPSLDLISTLDRAGRA